MILDNLRRIRPFVGCIAIQAIFAIVPATAQSLPTNTLADLAHPAEQQSIFPAASKLEVVFSGGCGVMEGVTSAPDGRVFFSEIDQSVSCVDHKGVPGGRIWVIKPGEAHPRIFREPSGMANGLAVDDRGGLIAAEGADFGGRRISRTDLRTGEYRVISYFYENRQLNAPNDVSFDKEGRIYFSDLRLFGPETREQRIEGVYRLDPLPEKATGLWPITRIIGNNSRLNGVEVSNDNKRLYIGVCDVGSAAIGEQPAPDIDRGGTGGADCIFVERRPSLQPPCHDGPGEVRLCGWCDGGPARQCLCRGRIDQDLSWRLRIFKQRQVSGTSDASCRRTSPEHGFRPRCRREPALHIYDSRGKGVQDTNGCVGLLRRR